MKVLLPALGKPEQAHVGQQLQFQAAGAGFALGARRGLARRAVDRALEVHVAEAALAALGHQQALAVLGQVADDLVGIDVVTTVPTGT
jgi:hypothetical protein